MFHWSLGSSLFGHLSLRNWAKRQWLYFKSKSHSHVRLWVFCHIICNWLEKKIFEIAVLRVEAVTIIRWPKLSENAGHARVMILCLNFDFYTFSLTRWTYWPSEPTGLWVRSRFIDAEFLRGKILDFPSEPFASFHSLSLLFSLSFFFYISHIMWFGERVCGPVWTFLSKKIFKKYN